MRKITIVFMAFLFLMPIVEGICRDPFPTIKWGTWSCPDLTGSWDSEGNAIFSIDPRWGEEVTLVFSSQVMQRYKIKLIYTHFTPYGLDPRNPSPTKITVGKRTAVPQYSFTIILDEEAHKVNYRNLNFQIEDKKGQKILPILSSSRGANGRVIGVVTFKSMPSLIDISYDPAKKEL